MPAAVTAEDRSHPNAVLAISTNVRQGDAEWLEPITDEEYHNLP
jgi:hypothetical protein